LRLLADPTDAVTTHGSSSTGVPQHPVQTWIKNFAVIANPNPTEGTNQLRSHKNGVAAGIGEWDLYWSSDVVSSDMSQSVHYSLTSNVLQFSIGGYVCPRLEFKHASPDITIFSIHVVLQQTYTITPLELFKEDPASQEKIEYPPETILLLQDGHTPASKRPRTDTKVLFHGQSDSNETDGMKGTRFTWQLERVRLPDDHHARPSTSPHTVSPFDIQHSLSLRVFFSVKGETLNGEPIEGADDTGEMRMLVVQQPERLSSVSSRLP
jgi:hypothetical protein